MDSSPYETPPDSVPCLKEAREPGDTIHDGDWFFAGNQKWEQIHSYGSLRWWIGKTVISPNSVFPARPVQLRH